MINRALIALAVLTGLPAGILTVACTPRTHGAPASIQHVILPLLIVTVVAMFALYIRGTLAPVTDES